MKRLSPLNACAALLLLLVVLISWAPMANAAGTIHPCDIRGLSAGAVLDVPFGQVAFSDSTTGTVAQASAPPIDIDCDPSDFNGSGKSPMLIRAQMPPGTNYDPTTLTWSIPTGDDNLKVEVQLVSSTPAAAPSGANPYDLVSLSLAVQTWSDVSFAIRLVKLPGPVDASKVSLPVTVKLYNSKDGNPASADIATVRIGSGTSIRSLSCLARDVPILLPTVTTADLSSPDTYSDVTAVPIEVTGCPVGTRLSVALTGTPAAGKSASSGIVQSTGTEPNVAVQIVDKDKNPVDISGATSRFMGQTPAGNGPVSITYYARYYALGPAQGGRVKATLTYTLSYP